MWATECIPRTRLRGAKSTNEASGTGLAAFTEFFRPDQRHRSQLYFRHSLRAASKHLVPGQSFVIADAGSLLCEDDRDSRDTAQLILQ